METINLYCSNKNIKPRLLLQHFLKFIGFYVEWEFLKTDEEDVNSVANVFIIDNDFVSETGIKSIKNNSIVILLDNWKITEIDSSNIKVISYNEKDEMKFLTDLISSLDVVMSEKSNAFLTRSNLNYKEDVMSMACAYLKYDFMPISQYAKYFINQDELYHMAFKKYKDFINEINSIFTNASNSFIKYVLLYTKFELNMICKVNNHQLAYADDDLLFQCEQLIAKYKYNEELYLIRLDILYELQSNWYAASRECQNKFTRHCNYVWYLCAKIIRNYYCDYDVAIALLEKAIKKNPNYYQAMYQLAICYHSKRDYEKSIDSFLLIKDLLLKKYERHELLPEEIEYFSRALMNISLIYQNVLWNKVKADEYYLASKTIIEEANKTLVFNEIFPEMSNQDQYKKILRNEVYKTLN